MKIVILLLIFFPLFILASGTYNYGGYTVCYEGFVPCGKSLCIGGELQDGKCINCSPFANSFVECEICHLFIMLDDIVDFILLKIIPTVGIIILIAGGIMFYFAGASPQTFSKAKSILTSAIIGLVIVYCSWLIINTLLDILEVAEWTGLKTWWEFSCQ